MRLACRRQARVIEQLSAVASNLRSGAAALRAENAELRSANERMGRHGGVGATRAGGALEVILPLDGRAPGAARIVVGCLRGRVPALVLDDAQLVVSELVTNGVCHSGASDGAIVVRLELTDTMVRLEVEDPGRGGAVAPRAPDVGGGFGLNLVQALCERWGLERVAAGGTRVWAQLARASARPSREASVVCAMAIPGSPRGRPPVPTIEREPLTNVRRISRIVVDGRHVQGTTMTAERRPPEGELAAAISNTIVGALARTTGRGPTKAKTTLGENGVFVVLQDTLTVGERSLAEAGEAAAVLDLRRRWQRVMQSRSAAKSSG